MSNPKELRDARRRVEEATLALEQIKALPRLVGSQVKWSNGVVWTRQGDDCWRPWSDHQPDDMPVSFYPSAHVASGSVVAVSMLGRMVPVPTIGGQS